MLYSKEKSKAWLCCAFTTSIPIGIATAIYFTFSLYDKELQKINNAEDYLDEHHCTDNDGDSYDEHCAVSASGFQITGTCDEVKYIDGNTTMLDNQCKDECITACNDIPEATALLFVEFIALCAFFSIACILLSNCFQQHPKKGIKDCIYSLFNEPKIDSNNEENSLYQHIIA